MKFTVTIRVEDDRSNSQSQYSVVDNLCWNPFFEIKNESQIENFANCIGFSLFDICRGNHIQCIHLLASAMGCILWDCDAESQAQSEAITRLEQLVDTIKNPPRDDE